MKQLHLNMIIGEHCLQNSFVIVILAASDIGYIGGHQNSEIFFKSVTNMQQRGVSPPGVLFNLIQEPVSLFESQSGLWFLQIMP